MALFWVVLLVVTMAWLGKEGYRSAAAYEKTARQMSELMQAERVAESRLKDLASTLTFGMVKNDLAEKMERLRELRRQQQRYTWNLAVAFGLAAAAALASGLFLAPRLYTALLSLGALIALVNGLITPILMIVVHKNVEYLGDVVLSFESKGILGSIGKLFEEGNTPLALIVLLFSILLPALKTLSLLFVSLFEYRPFAAKLVRFFKTLGKWSMLDVFIVSLLVVYLGSGNSDVSRSEIEIGVYFFAAYVFLSMAASLAAERMLEGAGGRKGEAV
ncbi:paraquat-inducible protein A [Nitratifractor sp.]